MKIADGIWSMEQDKGGNVHAYLVQDGDGFILIDTLYDDDAAVILSELAYMGKNARDIKIILETHAHKSHVGGLSTIQRMSGAPVLASESEIPIVEGKKKAAKVGFRLPQPFNLEVYKLQIGLNLGFGKHKPVAVSERLLEGRRIGPLDVISVPGHTPGSMAFWHAEKRVLFAGDSFATWPQIDIGWKSFNLDAEAAKRSVAKMAELQPIAVCCGHGDALIDGQMESQTCAGILRMLAA